MKLSISAPLLLFLSSSSSSDAFAPLRQNTNTIVPTARSSRDSSSSSTKLHYDIQRDPSGENVWSVLTNTERWIATTLENAAGAGNPLSRKEVSYVCETSQDPAMVLANIFRKLKEARQLGETHAQDQEDLVDASKDTHERAALRQTQVLVIPANQDILKFKVFDNLINAINQARRNARDYVTEVALGKLDERIYGDGDRDWCVSVNCAHLHPSFGEKTPEERLKEMQEEEEAGEVDLHLEEYKARRLEARRSPYPSVVVEVRAMAPPEFTPPAPSGPETPDPIEDVEPEVTADFVNSLEALFAKSSLEGKNGAGGSSNDFYDAIGSHIEEVSAVTPLSLAQNWIAAHDELFDIDSCAFTTSDTAHVDEAYEFIFTNLAMQTTQFLKYDNTSVDAGAQKRQYLVMSNFLSSSATSMEKFAKEVENIMGTLPPLENKVQLSCFHPEHIEESRRCPVPTFVLQWQD